MTPRARTWLLRGAVAVAVAALIALGWAERDRSGPVLAGAEAPDFRLPTLDGDTLALHDLRGRVVLLNFWATWCAPCRHEMPSMERAWRAYREQGLEVVAVSVDASQRQPETPAQDDAGLFAEPGGDVAAFVREYGLTFPIPLDPQGEMMSRFGVFGLPTTLLIGRDGRVRERVLGAREWDEGEMAAALRAALAETS